MRIAAHLVRNGARARRAPHAGNLPRHRQTRGTPLSDHSPGATTALSRSLFFTCQSCCAPKDRTKENQSLGALAVGAKFRENDLFLVSVTMPAYQKLLAAQADKAPAKEPAKGAARPSESARATARHVVRRPSSRSGASAASSCHGNPIWCRLAGLPDNSGAPPTGRPPEFMGGYVPGVGAGMPMWGFRHY
jgi:hypothetical protein